MGLNQIMSTAVSGLNVAQTQLRVVSDNIANVNTPGYVRKVADQGSVVYSGIGAGVNIQDVHIAADKYLQAAGRSATAASAGAAASADLFDRAQGLFGDPSGDSSFFSNLESALSAFSAAGSDPTSTVSRATALDAVSDFLSQASGISSSLNDLRSEADSRIGADVDTANTLLSQIDKLNTDIRRAQANGGDSSGSESTQSGLIDQLSSLMNVSVQQRAGGGVVIRAANGAELAGDGAATLNFTTSPNGVSQISVTVAGNNTNQSLPLTVNSGEIGSLMDMRNTQLPTIQQQLSEYVSGAVDALNTAHNASTSVPAPASLTGRNTGLDLPTAVGGFTGKTSIAILGSDGTLAHKVDIDFDAGTMSLDGGAASSFTASTFLSQLNTTLGANGSASFNNGALTLSASGGNGVAIVDDATTPSSKAGKGFSSFFGMNDLITSNTYADYNTGLKPTDPGGFSAGGTLTVRITDASGATVRDIPVSIPAGGTMQNVLDAMNSTTSGVGLYGSFSLDANGAMQFTPQQAGAASYSIVGDSTQRGAGGPSVSQLFGLGATARANRTGSYSLRTDIAGDSSKLALATVNLSGAALGTKVAAAGDGSGGLRLADAASQTRSFAAAGDLSATQSTVSNYGAQLAGLIGRKAAAADSAKTNADALSTEASAQRSSVEGVNLDQELVNLTTYQQAYNASARLIQATKDMYDILTNLVN